MSPRASCTKGIPVWVPFGTTAVLVSVHTSLLEEKEKGRRGQGTKGDVLTNGLHGRFRGWVVDCTLRVKLGWVRARRSWDGPFCGRNFPPHFFRRLANKQAPRYRSTYALTSRLCSQRKFNDPTAKASKWTMSHGSRRRPPAPETG